MPPKRAPRAGPNSPTKTWKHCIVGPVRAQSTVPVHAAADVRLEAQPCESTQGDTTAAPTSKKKVTFKEPFTPSGGDLYSRFSVRAAEAATLRAEVTRVALAEATRESQRLSRVFD